MFTMQLDNELKGIATQIRVAQGHEPRHFLKIFKGKLISYIGDGSTDETKLFRVRGTCADDVRAVELPAIATSLASDDVFILQSVDALYIWNGAVCFLVDTILNVEINIISLIFTGRIKI